MEHATTPPTAVVVSDIGNGERLQALLEGREYRVLHFRTFRAALDMLVRGLHPVVVLLDTSLFTGEDDRDAALATLQLVAGDVVVEVGGSAHAAGRGAPTAAGQGRTRRFRAGR